MNFLSLKENLKIPARDHDVHSSRKYNIYNVTWRHLKSHCPPRRNLSFPLSHTFSLSLSFSIFSEIYFLSQNGVLGKSRQETFRHTTLLFHQHTAAGDSWTWACAREQRDVPSSHHQFPTSSSQNCTFPEILWLHLWSHERLRRDTPTHSQPVNSLSCIVRSTHTTQTKGTPFCFVSSGVTFRSNMLNWMKWSQENLKRDI